MKLKFAPKLVLSRVSPLFFHWSGPCSFVDMTICKFRRNHGCNVNNLNLWVVVVVRWFFYIEYYVICVCMTWSVQKGSLTKFFIHGDEVSVERERDITICVCMVKATFVVWQWGFGGETRGHHSHIVRCVGVCFCLFVASILFFGEILWNLL